MSGRGRGAWRGGGRGRGRSSISSPAKPASVKNAQVVLHQLTPPRFGVTLSQYDVRVIDAFRSLPARDGGVYDRTVGYWHFPFTMYDQVESSVAGVDGWQFQELPPFIRDDLMSSRYLKKALQAPVPTYATGSASLHETGVDKGEEVEGLDRIPSRLRKHLYRFQMDAVIFAVKRDGRILVADEMGLGKTVEGIAIACVYRSEWPVLIVCPSGLRDNWRRELTEWVPNIRAIVVKDGDSGLEYSSANRMNTAFIVSYGLLQPLVTNGRLAEGQFQVILCDESHSLKSPMAARTKTAIPLLQSAKRVVCLTGTPVLSRPEELFTTLQVLMPQCFGEETWMPFAERYCGARQGPLGLDTSGATNTRELKLVLDSTVMIRRLKDDVLGNLPPKRRELVMVEVSQSMRMDLDDLLKQKAIVDTSLRECAKNSEMAQRMSQEQQALTARLSKLTGLAKVNGVIAHLTSLLKKNSANTSSKKRPRPGSQSDEIDLSQNTDDEGAVYTTGSAKKKKLEDYFAEAHSGTTGKTTNRKSSEKNASDKNPSETMDIDWICGVCTLANAPNVDECAVCGTQSQSSTRSQDKVSSDSTPKVARKKPGKVGSSAKPLGKVSDNPNKMVVFAHHKEVLDQIERGMKKAGAVLLRIDGNTPQNKRAEIVEKFQTEDEYEIILLGITAAGVGITLTAASTAIFAEMYWTPGVMTQAEDRIHRIGQHADVVILQYLVGENTVDQQLLKSLNFKHGTLQQTTGLNKDAGNFHNIQVKVPTTNVRPTSYQPGPQLHLAAPPQEIHRYTAENPTHTHPPPTNPTSTYTSSTSMRTTTPQPYTPSLINALNQTGPSTRKDVQTTTPQRSFGGTGPNPTANPSSTTTYTNSGGSGGGGSHTHFQGLPPPYKSPNPTPSGSTQCSSTTSTKSASSVVPHSQGGTSRVSLGVSPPPACITTNSNVDIVQPTTLSQEQLAKIERSRLEALAKLQRKKELAKLQTTASH